MKNLATPLPEPLIDVQVMSYYFQWPTQLVRYKTRKKGFEQLASISLSLGCGASIINYSPRFLMTMFYYLVLLSTEKSSPHGCICPIFWVPDLLGQSFPPRKQDSETSPFRLFHSPAFAPPAELKQASNMLGWEIPPLWRKTPRTPMPVARRRGTPQDGKTVPGHLEPLCQVPAEAGHP